MTTEQYNTEIARLLDNRMNNDLQASVQWFLDYESSGPFAEHKLKALLRHIFDEVDKRALNNSTLGADKSYFVYSNAVRDVRRELGIERK